MSKRSQSSDPQLYQNACTAYESTNWYLAKKLFSEYLLKEEKPEALEKYAWTTWWLGEEKETFTARERAYTLYRKINDFRSAARTALWIASDYLEFRGENVIANGWRQRAGRLLSGKKLLPEHGWLALQNGAVAIELEQEPKTAIQHAREAAKIGRILQVTDLEVIGMAMEGLAITSQGNIDEGMQLLDEAGIAATAGEVQELYSVTWTFCYLIYACERIRDLERVKQWCDKMKELSQRINFRFTLGICRAHFAGTLIWQGKWSEAESELQGSLIDLESSRPPYVMESIARLGELRRRQGRFAEAQKLFDQVEYHPIAILGKAEILIDKNANFQSASEMIDYYLRTLPAANLLQQIPALELQTKIFAETGMFLKADNVYRKLKDIVSLINTLPIRGSVYYTGGLLALCKKEYKEACQLLQDAVYCFGKCSITFETSMARLNLARALSKIGRIPQAQMEVQSAFNAFHQIGAIHGRKMSQKLLEELGKSPKRGKVYLDQNTLPLTHREVEVLRLVADGKTDKQIAGILFRSEHTVHRHISNILQKLNVSSRSAAVAALAKSKIL
ncbi:MAG TPA: LuxR C-terminal-related transcriptional regulator [Saprospiraceae bacterium]|nr:LuxR C-terminal-related transcriptional regulator [Saprospiraceae bacterium]